MQNDQQNSGSLKDRFEGYGAAPSEGLWDRIEDSLDEKKKRRGIIWWWFGGIAAVLVLAFGMYKLGYKDGAEISQNSEVKIETSEDQNELSNKNSVERNEEYQIVAIDTTIENDSSEEIDPESIQKDQNVEMLVVKEEKNESKLEGDELNLQIIETHIENSPLFDREIEKIRLLPPSKIPFVAIDRVEPVFNPEDFVLDPIQKPERLPIYFGFAVTSRRPISYSMAKLEATPTSMTDFASTGLGGNTVTNSGNTQVGALYNAPEPIVESWVSRTVGLNFYAGKYLSKRFAVQTGLDINYWRFTTQYDAQNIQYARTSLFTLGIPAKVKLDLINKERFHLYSAGGLIVEIPVVERIKTSYYNDVFDYENHLNFGLMGALEFDLGAEFRLKEKLFLNVNPGFRWYFMQRIDATHPLARKNNWFCASLGLRWEI